MHEFHISFNHTEWHLPFHSVKAMRNWNRSAIKLILNEIMSLKIIKILGCSYYFQILFDLTELVKHAE